MAHVAPEIELLELIKNQGSIAKVTPLVQTVVKAGLINHTDPDGNTALHLAAINGNIEIVKVLMRSGAYDSVRAKNQYGRTPLHSAVRNGNPEVVQKLLECGAIVTEKDKDGQTPMHTAVRNGHAIIVKKLLECGASATEPDNEGLTPVHIAAVEDKIEALKALMVAVPNIDVVTPTGQSALHLAVKNHRPRMVQYLMFRKANPALKDAHDETPLDLAKKHEYLDLEKLLASSGKVGFFKMCCIFVEALIFGAIGAAAYAAAVYSYPPMGEAFLMSPIGISATIGSGVIVFLLSFWILKRRAHKKCGHCC